MFVNVQKEQRDKYPALVYYMQLDEDPADRALNTKSLAHQASTILGSLATPGSVIDIAKKNDRHSRQQRQRLLRQIQKPIVVTDDSGPPE